MNIDIYAFFLLEQKNLLPGQAHQVAFPKNYILNQIIEYTASKLPGQAHEVAFPKKKKKMLLT